MERQARRQKSFVRTFFGRSIVTGWRVVVHTKMVVQGTLYESLMKATTAGGTKRVLL